ncbi:MAG: hypothetical protein NBV63_02135 [Candidatus Pacebacteria bacterium]|nr:hypothetical protein [Candidatus Paceibacterota bacterium]
MMFAIAILGDLLSLIPGVNLFSTIFTATGLAVVGAGTKQSIFRGAGGATTMATILVEIIPGLSMLPTWTLRVALNSAFSKDDKKSAG